MKHLILLLYVLSLMSGIGIMSLAGFFYFKTRLEMVRYYIGQHLFVTLYVFVDTASFYIGLNDLSSMAAFFAVIAGVLISSVGLVYYLWQFAFASIGKEIGKVHRKKYFFTSIGTIVLFFIVLTILDSNNLISSGDAFHTIFAFCTFFCTIGIGYSGCILVKNRNMLEENVRMALTRCLSVISIILPLAIVLNIFEYYIDFGFPTAMSPLAYFLLNTIVLFYARRYYLHQTSLEKKAAASKYSFAELIMEYGLTEREQQLIEMVIEGFNNREIGEKLFISPNTVKNHIYNAYKKIGVKNRIELINALMPIQNKSDVEHAEKA